MYSNVILAVARNMAVDPYRGILVGKIAWILGKIVSFFFDIVSNVTEVNCLGISIIFLTIFTRCLMIPIAYKQQKSMQAMQSLQPELMKIQEKYKGQMTDPEIQKKVNLETQKLYSKYDYNPLSGCLPMIIQLPIFFGLYRVMQNPFAFIDAIQNIYNSMSTMILTEAGKNPDVLEIITSLATSNGIKEGTTMSVSMFNALLNVLSPADVAQFVDAMPHAQELKVLYEQKTNYELFLGLNLTEVVGLTLSPKLILPVLSGVTTWLSTWLMTRKNKPTDPAMVSQQRVMSITMPLMMAWITTSCPGGIGVYWITSNCFQLIQQLILNKYFETHKVVLEEKKPDKKGKKK